MHILFDLLGLVFVVVPLISCQHTGYTCGVESACSNLTTDDDDEHPNLLAGDNDAAADLVKNQPTNFVDYINVGDSAQKYFDIAKRIWNTDRALKLYFMKNDDNDTFVELRFADGDDVHQQNEVGRTFGIRRRMQLFLWLPISFKLGVIVTLLLVLTTMSLKTLIIGFIILLLLLTRTNGQAKLWGAQRHAELADVHKNVHIHVHTLPEDPHQAFASEPLHANSPPYAFV